jgi:putative membrane protein
MMHYGYAEYGTNWGFLFFPIIWIFVSVLIMLLFWGWHKGDRYTRPENNNSAENILADRFAKGEIDEKEYEKRLEILKKHNNIK